MADQYQHEVVTLNRPLSAWVWLHTAPESNYVAPHWHQGIELSYTLTGQIDDFMISGQHYQTSAGTILVVNSQSVHSVTALAAGWSQALSVIFPYDYVRRFYPEIEQQIIKINHPKDFTVGQQASYMQLQGLLYQMVLNLKQETRYTNLKLESLLTQILQLLLENFTQPKAHSGVIYGKDEVVVERIQVITQYVNEHYQERVTLAMVAATINVTKQYLTRFFKQHMDLTVGQYLNNVRAQHAYEAILSHTGNLTSIANQTGFASTRALNAAFEALYQQTATAFYKQQTQRGSD